MGLFRRRGKKRRRGKFGKPTNTRPPARSFKGRNSRGKKKTSAQTRSRLTTIRTKTAAITPKASPFAVKKRAFVRRSRTTKPAPPKRTPRRAPSPPAPPSRAVRRITPPTPKVIKSRPTRHIPPAVSQIVPRAMGRGVKGDRGFNDVVHSFPPPRRTPSVRGSKPRIPIRTPSPFSGGRTIDVFGDQSATTFYDRPTQAGPRRAGELGGGLFTRDDRREPRGFDTSSLQVPRGDRAERIPRPPRPTVPQVKPIGGKNLTVRVTSSPSNAEVLVNGVPAGVKLTPSVLSYTDKQLIGTTKTVTVRRTGYSSNESYSITGRVKEEVKIVERKVLDDAFDDFVEPSFMTGGLNHLMIEDLILLEIDLVKLVKQIRQ